MPENNTPMDEEVVMTTFDPTPAHANTEFAKENAAVKPRRKINLTDKPPKKPVKPNRLPEDCYMTDPKKMTDKEKNDVILFYQASVEEIQAKYRALDQNTQGAFAQARQLQEENERLRREAATKVNLLKQNISTLFQNSLLVEMGGK